MAKAKPTEPTVETTDNGVDAITDIPTESVEVTPPLLNEPAPERVEPGHPSRDFYTAL